MIAFLKKSPTCRVVLVEKVDPLYRNIRDWVSIDDVGVELHFVKEGLVVSDSVGVTRRQIHLLHPHRDIYRVSAILEPLGAKAGPAPEPSEPSFPLGTPRAQRQLSAALKPSPYARSGVPRRG